MTNHSMCLEMVLIVLSILVCSAFTFEETQMVQNKRLLGAWKKIKKIQKIGLAEKVNGTGCSCIGYQCGCCAHLDVPKIKLNDTGCVNITYLPSPVYGISVTFSLDGHIYYNYSVSARNPPPLCFGIPHLEKYASICIRFYNLSVSADSFSACVRLEARLAKVDVENIELGCFKIPPTDLDQTLRYMPNSRVSGKESHGRLNGALGKIMLKLDRYYGYKVAKSLS